MCIDFKNLNKACPKDFYPLPRIDQLVDSTCSYELLSMMDASQGYHQIMLAPEDRKRISFITSAGTFCYVTMPFGLKHAGATYQRLVDKIFHPKIGRNVELEGYAPTFFHIPSGEDRLSIKTNLGKPDTFGSLIKWTVELSENDISYLPQTTIKAQALADFISEIAEISLEDTSKTEKWLLHVDGSSTIQGSGAVQA
ncbi:UNVERIFIED_CONTAM: hypothetical protein Sradi_5761900 [Sesamum radiatum]|uniref:Reverse transcriptase domain-containing protein n=1 Tax=Sesamum radiatum TaxID=300843 RepID=A0AAW2L666_SESRA